MDCMASAGKKFMHEALKVSVYFQLTHLRVHGSLQPTESPIKLQSGA